MGEHMITTVDNPFDYFTQFKAWYTWDTSRGHHTLAYLERVAMVSDELPEALYSQAIEDAIQDILDHDESGVYIRVSVPAETVAV